MVSGLVYVPTTPFLAELHFIVNGVDQGVFASDIPHNTVPLYVVVDVYGCTKKVRVVQLFFKGKFLLKNYYHLKNCVEINMASTFFNTRISVLYIIPRMTHFFNIICLVPSLQELCRDAILQHIKKNAVSSLPLPTTLKKYLLGFNSSSICLHSYNLLDLPPNAIR